MYFPYISLDLECWLIYLNFLCFGGLKQGAYHLFLFLLVTCKIVLFYVSSEELRAQTPQVCIPVLLLRNCANLDWLLYILVSLSLLFYL